MVASIICRALSEASVPPSASRITSQMPLSARATELPPNGIPLAKLRRQIAPGRAGSPTRTPRREPCDGYAVDTPACAPGKVPEIRPLLVAHQSPIAAALHKEQPESHFRIRGNPANITFVHTTYNKSPNSTIMGFFNVVANVGVETARFIRSLLICPAWDFCPAQRKENIGTLPKYLSYIVIRCSKKSLRR